jgi:hypothetical protein
LLIIKNIDDARDVYSQLFWCKKGDYFNENWKNKRTRDKRTNTTKIKVFRRIFAYTVFIFTKRSNNSKTTTSIYFLGLQYSESEGFFWAVWTHSLSRNYYCSRYLKDIMIEILRTRATCN